MRRLLNTILLLLPTYMLCAQNPEPYISVSPSDLEQIEQLISQMSVAEKVGQLASFYPNGNKRLGIPHMQAGEALHGVVAPGTTSFPQAIALASSWDTALVKRVSSVIAKEARAMGIHHVYTPMLGVVRDARWGRFEEGYGEDPYLVSRIGVSFINGLQGEGDNRFGKDKVVATAKHYVADGEPMQGANGAAVEISRRALHEVHLPPFRAAIAEARVGGIMPAHHSLNGEPCHLSPYLMNDVLRGELGFDGLVVSDNNDIRWAQDRLFVADSRPAVIRKALEAGVHTELAWLEPWGDTRLYGPPLIDAVEKGLISESLLDNAVWKVLEFKFALKLAEEERPYGQDIKELESRPDIGEAQKDVFFAQINAANYSPRTGFENVLNTPAHDSLALEAARKSIILLENKSNALPLTVEKLNRIAVIGPNADTVHLGTYSTQVPKYVVTVKEGIERLVAGRAEVVYAKGTSIQHPTDEEIHQAVLAAESADVAVVVLGDDHRTVMENVDRDDITLPGHQQQLLEAVYNTGTPVILVLLHGRPAAIQWAKDHVHGILDGWFLGQETGTAVAEALFGQINPSGKLTVSYPRGVGQLPYYYNHLPYGRIRKLWNSTAEPTYPFGYGLSYTTFEYSNFSLSDTVAAPNKPITVYVDVQNTGKRAGEEIVQLYIHDQVSSLTRPVKELKGFQKILLQPGEKKTVQFVVTVKSLEFWKDGEWITEPGKFSIMAGPHSEKLHHTELHWMD